MKFISVRDLKNKSARIWKELPENREMVLTSNGRPIAILSAVNEDTLEQGLAAFRRARAVLAVEAMQYESTVNGADSLTGEDVAAEIMAVRRKRKGG